MTRSSRRAVCALTLVGALVLAACGSDSDSGGDTTASGGTEATTVESTEGTDASTGSDASTPSSEPTGDASGPGVPLEDIDLDATLTIAYTSPVTSFDPHRQKTDGEKTYTLLVYDTLTQIDLAGQVIPMLAESWEFSPDGSALTLKLRDDVTFHDGTKFDAAAVKANLERVKTIEGGTQAGQLSNVTSVDVIDPTTVQLNLTGGGAALPAVFTGPAGAMISPKAIADPSIDLLTTSAGSGPYVLSELRAGQGATMTKAPGTYWDPQRQLAAEIAIDYVPDPVARMNGVRAGDLDLAQVSGVDIVNAFDAADAGEYNAHRAQLRTVHSGLINVAPGSPLADPKVRQALNFAVDRDAIAEGIFGGYCNVSIQPFAPDYWATNPAIDDYFTHDPDKAKEMLAEAGAENLTFDMQVPPGSYQPISQAMQAQLAEVGVTMNIIPTDVGPAYADFAGGKLQSLFLVMLNYPDPAVFLDSWAWGGINMTQGLDPAVLDGLKAQAEEAKDGSLSEEERGKIYQDIMYTLLVDQAIALPACQTSQAWISTDGVVGVENMPGQEQGTVVPDTVAKLKS